MYIEEDLGQFNIVDDYGLMLRKPMSWEPTNGEADSLFRTSQAFVAYGNKEILDSILDHCVINDGERLIRHPDHKLNDNSRDQTIMFMYALKFNEKQKVLNQIVDKLKYKLSDRFNMTPTMWLWLRALKGNKLANIGYQLIELLSLFPSLLVTWMFRRLSGFNKEYPQDNVPALFMDSDVNSKFFYKAYDSLEYPSYATHLGSMMIFSVKRIPILTWTLNKLFICDAEKSNYYIRLLNNDETAITDYRESGFKSMWGVRWSSKLDGRSTEFIIDNYEKKYNALDVDLMEVLITKYKLNKFFNIK